MKLPSRGCGRGDFLRLLCRLGDNSGFGFDPSLPPELAGAGVDGVTLVRGVYSDAHAVPDAALVCCRHVLEHLDEPAELLQMLRRTAVPLVFFEVPNAIFTIRDLGVWDLIYEHPSYYSAASLERLVRGCGFEVRRLEPVFEGQFLSLVAAPGRADAAAAPEAERAELAGHVAAFAEAHRRTVERWREELAARAGRTVVLWGAGSKGVTFLNALEVRDAVRFVVDVNPRKQGHHVAGTGQRIVPPQALREHRPDSIIVLNPIYREEIERMARELDLRAEFLS